MVAVRIEPCSLGNAQLTPLLTAAVAELRVRYPDYTGEHPLNQRTEFLLALVDGKPAGCVGIHPLDQTRAEIKRLYVTPTHRGNGVARALISELERSAAGMGYQELLLETGTKQPEAIALYQSMGYHPIPAFSDDYPPSRVTRCFQKRLAAPESPPPPRSR